MTSSTPPLDALRLRIDEIDDQLHDLIMERARVVASVRAAKASDGAPALRPGREAQVVRRLVARHDGAFPRASLVRIWRELMAASLGMQTKLAIAVFAPDTDSGYWDLARDHFGSHTPITGFRSIGQVIRAVTDGTATAGILPMPQEGDRDPWWRLLVSNDETTPRVFARLPFGQRGNARGEGDALAIGLLPTEPTGQDRSLLVVETTGEISRARLFSTLAQVDLPCGFFAAFELGTDLIQNFLDVDGFVPMHDPRLQLLSEQAGPAVHRILSIGSYAIPVNTAEPPAEPKA